MRIKRVAVSGFVAVLACVSMLGCGGSEPETAEIKGTVTYKGSPVADAMITFFPADSGRPASGAVKGGDFTVNATPGSYKVAIMPMMEGKEGEVAGDPEAAATEPPFPGKYQNPDTSGLTAEVAADGSSTAAFELTD